MSNKSIKKNYIFNVAYQILTLLTPLITAPYLSRVLQPDGIGSVSFAESIVSYFSLIAVMGIGVYGQREISYVQNDLEKRSVVFWNTKILSFITSGILIFTFFQRDNSIIYIILTLNLVSAFFDITWFFQGMEDFSKTVTRNAAFKLLNIIYIFVFVRDKGDLNLYVLGLGLFSVLGNLSLWAYLPKYINRIPISELKPFKDIKVVWSLFIPTIAIQIYTVLDKTMIGLITDSSYENGYYEQALKISKMLLTIVSSLIAVMIPRMGLLFEQKNTDEIQRYMYRSYRFVWFLGIPLCFGMIMSSDNFVPWFFGSGYEKVSLLLKILPMLILAIGINSVTGGQLMIPSKRQNLFSVTVIIGAVVNLILNTVLIYFFKSVGAAIASVAAETTIAIVQLIFVRKEISIKKVLAQGVPYYIAGTVMVICLIPLRHFLNPSPVNSLLMLCCGAVSYFLMLLSEKDEFFISNVSMIVTRVVEKMKSKRSNDQR